MRSSAKELCYYRSDGFRSNVVRLPFQGVALPIGKNLRNRVSRSAHKWKARPTVNDYRGNIDGGDPFRRQGIVAHDGRIIGECVRNRLLRLPPRRLARLGDEFLWHAHHFRHEELNRITSPTCRDQLGKSLCRVRRWSRRALVNKVGWFPQREPGDLVGELAGRF